MATVALKSGDTIWGLVAKKLGPGASNAEIAAATNKVLKANGETAASARTMQVGEQVNLDVLDPKKPAAKPADPAAPAAGAPADPANPADPTNPATTAALGEAEKRQQEQLAQLGLGTLPPGLAQLLNSVYAQADPTVQPFLGSLTFNPQALVNGAAAGGAVNIPGATPGAGPTSNSLSGFLNTQAGLNPGNTNALAFNTGSFVNQISGLQFTAFDPARILAQFPGLVA